MKDISNKTLAILLVVTIVVSLGGTFISLGIISSMSRGGGPSFTGFAVSPNATAQVTLESFSSIKFSQSSINFGTGSVNSTTGINNCSLTTVDGPGWENSAACAAFSPVTNGFTIENDGNANLTVELISNQSAAQFIGSTALFLWNVTLNESNSCVNITGARASVYPNTSDACLGVEAGGACGSIFESVSTSYKTICPSLLYDNAKDSLNVDINITIPYDAPTGAKLAGFTVRGTREPLI